jgi:hypothetical protein
LVALHHKSDSLPVGQGFFLILFLGSSGKHAYGQGEGGRGIY